MSKLYEATVTRSGDWWAIEVTSGLPASTLGFSQVRRLNDAEDMTRRLIVDLLEVAPSAVEVSLTVDLPADLALALDSYCSADLVESDARTRAAQMRSVAATSLLEAHLTMREAGQILGLSHQRIKQLVDRAPNGDGRELRPASGASKKSEGVQVS